jgi:hypothetical protein
MKIESSSIILTSSHEFRQEQSREESLRFWIGQERPLFAGTGQDPDAVQVRLSPEARQLHAIAAPQPQTDAAAVDQIPVEDPKLMAMRLILEALTGRKIRINSFEPATPAIPATPSAMATPEEQGQARQGWGLEYDLHERFSEQETLLFSATGRIRTMDGQTIDFKMDLAMHRQFVEETDIRIRAGDALLVDPLVINFAAPAAELSDMKFSFDLTGDGRNEEISFVGAGSGFLALDRNNDGVINNGLELFGPASGNGFAELALLDADGNGWLDDNDPLFASLRIWMRNAAGNTSLVNLAEKNIGAIFLQPAQTPFSLKTAENSLLGKVRESSVFLTEDGRVGTIQEIDLAV